MTPSISLSNPATPQTAPPRGELREKFDQFVGESLFGQMLKSMRKTVGKPAYFHGGHAEETFQSQLDQMLVEKISAASAEQISGPMYELFTANRHAHANGAFPAAVDADTSEEAKLQLEELGRTHNTHDFQTEMTSANRLDLSI